MMPEAVASGDVNMGSTNVHMGPASAEVSAAQMTSTEVAAAKVASPEMTAASVSTTSMTTASTTSKGRCRDYRTTQKDSGSG
jgi:hypothetical protein